MSDAGHSAIPHFIKELFDVEWWGEWGISRALFLSIVFAGLLAILSLEVPNLLLFSFDWLVGTAPIWLPISLLIAAEHVWIWYIQTLYLAGRKPVLLEVKMPREVMKSPRAMEIAFTSFSLSSGETTFIQRAWMGQVRPFFSFEIASFGGEIHFYIWCWDNYKETVEAALYAQYPELEIYEVEDYASKFRFDAEKHDAWGVEWPLMTYMDIGMNDFRINAYPIRTYVDFELDQDPKEEFKIDPLGQILEFMGNIKPNEQIWIQMVIRKSGKLKIFNLWGAKDQDNMWKKMVEDEVTHLREQSIFQSETFSPQSRASAAWRYTRMMESMERNLGKYPFEVGMRGIYWTEGNLRGPVYTGLRWIWRPFGNPQYATHLRPRRWHCDFDYPWQDFRGLRWINQTRRVHDAYRRRLFFHSPWILPTNVMTNEVLATLWHPPSRSVSAPGLERISATKAAAPPNLPK